MRVGFRFYSITGTAALQGIGKTKIQQHTRFYGPLFVLLFSFVALPLRRELLFGYPQKGTAISCLTDAVTVHTNQKKNLRMI